MATKEIKNRIVLEGEKEYNQAIREAQRNLRTLKSELKAETAELGKNATEQQKAETKARSLRKQIAEQEKIVKTLREGLEQAKKEYGDNADVVQKWENQLNNARATLANMKNDLQGVGDGLRAAQQSAAQGTVATKSFADSLGKIAEAGNAVSSGIESIFTGMVGTVRAAIADVWADMVDLAGRANAWSDLAGFWNTSATEIQKWERAVESSHNSFDDLSNAVTRINMGDPQKITEATLVSPEEYEDKWKYAMAVMEAMSKMDYEDRLNAAGEVFGEKRAVKILDLLNDWGKIQGKLARFDAEQGGVGLTGGQIEDMSTLAERIDKLKETWSAFVDEFEATHFAQLSLDLVGNAQRILDDLIKFVDSGDDADLEQLEKDIEEFFDRIKLALENAAGKLDEAGKKLQESDNGIVRLIGRAMSDLATALEWLSKDENIDKVIHGLEALAMAWGVGKIAGLVGSVAEFAANIRTIRTFGSLTSAGGMGAAAEGAAGSIWSGLGHALAGVTVAVSVAALAVPVASLLKSLIVDKKLPDWIPDPNKAKEVEEKVEELGLPKLSPFDSGGSKNAFRRAVGALFGGQNAQTEAALPVEEAAAASNPVVYAAAGTGPSRPHVKVDATAEQQAAANALWDAMRGGNMDAIGGAWEAMEQAFQGSESAFARVDALLDKMLEEWESQRNGEGYDPSQWMDIPSTWWRAPDGGNSGNADGLTGADARGMRDAVNGMPAAVRRGMAGMKLIMNGTVVGQLVADEVSRQIAGYIV